MNLVHVLVLFALTTISVVASIFIVRQPVTKIDTIDIVEYRYDNNETHFAKYPLKVPTEGVTLYVKFELNLENRHPNVFRLHPDDCIKTMRINGQLLPLADVQHCETLGNGKKINLREYLYTGKNRFEITIIDKGEFGGFTMDVDYSNSFYTMLITLNVSLFALLLFNIVCLLLQKISLRTMQQHIVQRVNLWLIFGFGVAVRVLYFSYTDYGNRSYDVQSHIDYINYIAKHLAIPPAQEGWEFHQNPLYYMLTGIWKMLTKSVGFSDVAILWQIKLFSLILSIAAFAIVFWISTLLFSSKKIRERQLFCLLFAGFPGLVFLSTRISNNVLYTTLMFFCFALLLWWWKRPTKVRALSLAVITGITLLTRASGLLLLPIGFLLLLLHPKLKVENKVTQGFLSICVITLLFGWLVFLRFGIEDRHSKVLTFGNDAMPADLQVESGIRNYLTFNPVSIVSQPYTNAWDDDLGRQHFSEYFYKTAFSGEFIYDSRLQGVASLLLLTSFVVFLSFLTGLYLALERFNIVNLVPLTYLFIVFLGQLSYRSIYTFSSNQDFRFSIPILLPVFYFAVIGIRSLPIRLQKPVYMIAGFFGIFCGVFTVQLALL